MSDHAKTLAPAPAGFFIRLIAGLLLFVTLTVGTGFYMSGRSGVPLDGPGAPLPPTTPTSPSADPAAAPGKVPTVGGQPLFARWPKNAPDAVVVFSGQTYGYLQPCGCSRPQLGGLERRYNFIETLKARGWPIVPLDLGDVTAPKGVLDHTYKKYEFTMKALKEMGYSAVGVGHSEFAVQLMQLIGRFALNNDDKPPYLLAGNLVGGVQRDANGKAIKYEEREKYYAGGPGSRPLVESFDVVTTAKAVPIGVVGTVGPSVAKKVVALDKEVDFLSNAVVLKAALAGLAAHKSKPELRVLLYQGTTDEAKAVAEDFPEFQVIACLSEESEPPEAPIKVVNAKTKTTTLVLQLGHKGRYVGVLGVFKTNDGLALEYQLVPLSEEFLTPENDPEVEKKHKILQLLEQYAEEVKKDKLLDLYTKNRPQHPLQIKHEKEDISYVGSEACMKCHAQEYAVWSKTKHAKGYEALEKLAKRPSLQQFNGECVKCHTVGFEFSGGFENKEKSAHLLHNGCENCHGPGSAHAKDPKNKGFIADTTPWRLFPEDKLPTKDFMEKMGKMDGIERGKIAVEAKTQRVVNAVSSMCTKCHDSENDPKFDFYKYFPQIHHSGLKATGLPPGLGK